MTTSASPATGTTRRPIVFRRALIVTMDDLGRVLPESDLVVRGDRIADLGPGLAAPDDAIEIDAAGGVLLPGLIDTHRHMWQTALRGFGADWTLSGYFGWFTGHRSHFRPEDVYAGNLLAAVEAVDAGVTTTVDWSNGLQSVEHAEAAVDALESVPGRFVLAYGSMFGPAREWAESPAVREFLTRRDLGRDMLGLQLAVDVGGDPAFPERSAFDLARELGVRVTGHTGIFGVLTDAPLRVMHDNGVMGPGNVYVHASALDDESYRLIARTGGSISIAAESEQHAGQGYPPVRAARLHGIPVSLSMDTSVWWSADLFAAMRATLGSGRADDHRAAREEGETLADNPVSCADVLGWATRGGADALGRGADLGRLQPGYKADVVLLRNDASPVSFPVLDPYGHVVLQAQRGDVHTVVVDGHLVKHEHRLRDVDLDAVRRVVHESLDHLAGAIPEIGRRTRPTSRAGPRRGER